MVEVGITIAGDVGSFGATERASLKEKLSQELDCHEPACRMTLLVASASVSVKVQMVIPC